MDDKVKLRRAITLFDLESYIHQTFSDIKRSGDELRVNCFSPKGCNGSDSKQHLWVNILKKRWICYRCGYGDSSQQEGTGWLPRFIADAEDVTISSVINRLLETIELTPADELEDLLADAFNPSSTELPKGVIRLPPSFLPVDKGLAKAHQYGTKRGLTDEAFKIFDVRFCIRQGIWKNRLIFPIRNLDGKIMSATGRHLTNKDPVWRVWPYSDIQSLLWPLAGTDGQSLRDARLDHVVLVEGVFDWVGVQSVGYSALATFGKKLSQQQVEVLQELNPREVTLAWDYDARDKMVKVVSKLQGRFDVVNVFPFHSAVWKKRDFGDIPLHAELSDIFATEMFNRISVDSDGYVEWATRATLES